MSNGDRSRRPLPRIVKQLGTVSLFNDFASEMVYPLLPALVTTRLGGTAVALGVLDGVAEAASAVIKAASGWLSDKVGWRRPLVVGGYALAAAARPAMGVVAAAWQVIGLRAGDRVGKGARNPPRDAIIADATPSVQRGRAFGYHRAMDHAGAVLGPLVAWAMLAHTSATPTDVIRWSIVPGVVAVFVVAWALRGTRAAPKVHENAPPGSDPAVMPTPRPVFVFLLIVGFAFARFPETLLLLRLQDLGVSVAVIPVLWAVLHVIRSAASYPGGWLSDVLGPRRTLTVGWVIYAVVCVGLGFAGSPTVAVAWFLVFGTVAAATESPERAFVAAAGRASRRGRRFGIYHASVGLAALPGSIMFGALYAHVSAYTALLLSGGLAALLAVLGLAPIGRTVEP
jgi:MFS family permease